MEERQPIITLKNVGSSYKEIAKKVKVSVSIVSFTRHSETWRNRKRSGRPKVTTTPENMFLRVNILRERRLRTQAQFNRGRKFHVSVSL